MGPTLYAEKLRHVSPILYKTAAQLWVDRTYPRHLFIETTAACNLTCSYCPRERRGNHMDFALFTAIIDEASRYGPRSFSLHLFGEPLLYPRILEAIRYIKTKNFRHVVLLTTNGTKLNGMVDDVLATGVDKLIWTWRPDAQFTPDTKEKLRKWGHFMVRLITEITPADAMAEWDTWSPKEVKCLHNYGGQIDISKFTASPVVPPTRWPCYHLWLAPAVAWNGNILLCCADPKQQEVLGTFPVMAVAEAWQSQKLKEVRNSHLAGRYEGICRDCTSWQTYPDLFFKWQQNVP